MTNLDDSLDIEQVRHLSVLARINATDEEMEQMRSQLTSILRAINTLQELDTSDVEPTGHAIDVQNVFRDDAAAPSRTRDEMLANAPMAQEGYVRVRGVFDDEGMG